MENQIELIQKPEIKHALREAGLSVTKRISDLNLESLVATEDTVKSMKDLRADLNKEAIEFESQRKSIKTAILNPYDEFEAVYNAEIKEKYTNAVNLLKDKIGTFETMVKDEKKKSIASYFSELCIAEKIDFVKFEVVIPEINLSTTEKKYKETCNEYISKVVDDLKLIDTHEFAPEILVEYKSNMNVSKAITTVVERKAKEKAEAEKKQQIELLRRKNLLSSLGFVFMDMTNAYELDANTYIKTEDIEKLSTSDFNVKIAEFEAKIADNKQRELAAKQAKEIQKSPEVESSTVEKQAITTPLKPTEVIEAPTKEVIEEIWESSFVVKGTRTQLLSLSHFMKSNNINYINI